MTGTEITGTEITGTEIAEATAAHGATELTGDERKLRSMGGPVKPASRKDAAIRENETLKIEGVSFSWIAASFRGASRRPSTRVRARKHAAWRPISLPFALRSCRCSVCCRSLRILRIDSRLGITRVRARKHAA